MTQSKTLTASEKRIYEFVKTYQANHDVPPTIREIVAATGFNSTSTVRAHLQKLVYVGKLAKGEGSARSIGMPAPRKQTALSLDDQALIWQEKHCLIVWRGDFKGFEVWHPDQGLLATIGEVDKP